MPEKRKPNPITPAIAAFSTKWEKFSRPMVKEIFANINKGVPVTQSVNRVFRKRGVPAKFRNMVLAGILSSAEASGLDVTTGLGFKRWYLNKKWSGDKLNLSQRLNRLEFKQVAINSIQRGFKAGKSLSTIAGEITKLDLTKADVPRYINRVTSVARRVAAGDASALKAYRSAAKSAITQAEKLAKSGAPFTRLQKAYKNLINVSGNFNAKQLNRAVDRAIAAKARYNAERIMRTEGARAYGAGKMTQAKEDPDVSGMSWELSSAHNVDDICDFHAMADLYDMGEGIYPLDELPEYPAHPHCMCILSEVYGEKKDIGKFDEKEGNRALNRMPKSDQQQILGVQGLKSYKKTGNWQNNIRGYVKNPQPLPSIPKSVAKP